MLNIILLLLVATIVFKNLFSGFGYLNEEDMKKKKDAIGSFLKNANNSGTEEQKKSTAKDTVATEFKDEAFLKEAEKIVDMVTEAFNNGKLDTLAKLVENNVFNNFSKQLSKNLLENKSMHTVIVAFTEKTIIEKSLEIKQPFVAVKFGMNQINYVEDVNKNVIAGSKSKVEKIEEMWTFIKNNSQESSWRVKSIEGIKQNA